MGLSGPHFKLVCHDDMIYESWIDFKFIIVYKDVLVIMQGCIGDNKQGF